MPPPPIPVKQDVSLVNNGDLENVSASVNNGENKRKLETPLAAMLPSKYANVDVTELFPDFRHGQVRSFMCILYLNYNKFQMEVKN